MAQHAFTRTVLRRVFCEIFHRLVFESQNNSYFCCQSGQEAVWAGPAAQTHRAGDGSVTGSDKQGSDKQGPATGASVLGIWSWDKGVYIFLSEGCHALFHVACGQEPGAWGTGLIWPIGPWMHIVTASTLYTVCQDMP